MIYRCLNFDRQMKNMLVFNIYEESTHPTRFNGVKAQQTNQIHKPIKKVWFISLIIRIHRTLTKRTNRRQIVSMLEHSQLQATNQFQLSSKPSFLNNSTWRLAALYLSYYCCNVEYPVCLFFFNTVTNDLRISLLVCLCSRYPKCMFKTQELHLVI